jgi:hypothetical protein
MTIEHKKKKVLIISFSFPPENSIAAVRIGKFAKYLPEFGWEPVIITAKKHNRQKETLPVDINEANIYRTNFYTLSYLIARKLEKTDNKKYPTPELSSNHISNNWRKYALKALRLLKPIYSFPILNHLMMAPMDWYRSGLKKGLEIAQRGDINIIFSSYSPSVSHIIASSLQKRTGIPWVADFRDLWSSNPYSNKIEPFYFLEKQMEKRTIYNSTLLTTVSEPLARDLEELHLKKVVSIPNGFDDRDYSDNVPLLSRFTITYTGSIYPGKRDPTPLFQAIAELRDEGKIPLDGMEVRFFGSNVVDTIYPLVKKFGIDQFVKVYGLVSFKESIRKQKESTILLLLSWNDPKDKGVYTGKVFEYLGASRPILAIGLKGGVIDELLLSTGSGKLTTDVMEIKSTMIKWFEEFDLHRNISTYYNPEVEAIQHYTRREQAGKLARLFDRIIA